MSAIDIAALKAEATEFGYEPATSEYREFLERRMKEEREYLRKLEAEATQREAECKAEAARREAEREAEAARREAERERRLFESQEREKEHKRALELQAQENSHSQEMARLSPAPSTPPPAVEDAQAAARRLLPPPASFNPKEEELDKFLSSYSKYCELTGVSNEHKAIGLTSLLPGDLRAVLDVLPTCDRQDYEKVREALLKATQYTPEFCRRRFRDVEPTEQDNTKTLLLRKAQFLDDWLKASKVDEAQLRNFLVIDDFLRSMPVGYAAYVREGNSYDINVIAERGDRFLDLHHAGRSLRQVQQYHKLKTPRNSAPQKAAPQHSKSYQNPPDKQISSFKSTFRDQRPHSDSYVKKDHQHKDNSHYSKEKGNYHKGYGQPPKPQAPEAYCIYHKSSSHSTEECRGRPSTSSNLGAIQLAPQASAPPQQSALHTLLYPHTTWVRNPNLPQAAGPQPNPQPPASQAQDDASNETPRRLSALSLVSQTKLQTCQGELDSQPVTILLDSGAEGVFVDSSLVREDQFTGQEVPVLLPEGSPVKRPVCWIHLECPYYTGRCQAVALHKPAQQVYLGPIPGCKPFPGIATALQTSKNTPVSLSSLQETGVPGPAKPQATEPSSLCPAPLQVVNASLHHPPEAQDTAATLPPADPQDVDVPPLHPASLRESTSLPVDSTQFAADQRACPTLTTWHQLASTSPHRAQNRVTNSPQYLYVKGLLYQKTLSGDQECLRLCVPQCHRSSIISLAHHDPHLGHQGPTETLEKLKRSYVWPYLHAEVSRYARTCLLCQTSSPQVSPNSGYFRKPSPNKRHPASYNQAPSYGRKPWFSPPHWNRWAPRTQQGFNPSAIQAHPACPPLAKHAPGRRSHSHLPPGAIRAPPAHFQASPHTYRRF